MPNRIIREAILSSAKMARLSWAEEVFFRRLMSMVDDYGRAEADPQYLRSRCYPMLPDAKVKAKDVLEWMIACQRAGLVECYEVAGKPYIEVLNFNQQRRTESKFPPPPSRDSKCAQEIANGHLGVVGGVSVVVVEDGGGARAAGAPAELPVEIPDWVPRQQWDDFVEMRRAKGKRSPFTRGAAKGIIAELEKLRRDGQDPTAVLQQSINSGWSGVFAVKGAGSVSTTKSWWDTSTGIIDRGMQRGLPAPPKPIEQNRAEWYRFMATVWLQEGEGPWLDERSEAYPIYKRLRDGGHELAAQVMQQLKGEKHAA